MTARTPIKVLHLLHALGMGGAETWLMELLRHWSKSANVQMHFLATGGVPGVFDDEARQLGAQIHYLRYGRDNAAEFFVEFRRLLARENFDAIHDHADLTSGWHFLIGAGRLPPVRVAHVHNPLMHLHANYAVTRRRMLMSVLGRQLVMRMATHVCGTSSKSLIEYGFKVGSRRPCVSVVHCGFDITSFHAERGPDRDSVLKEFGLSADAKVVLFAGRIDRDLELRHARNHKNSWLAVCIGRAAAGLRQDIFLLMAGAGDEQRHRIEKRIDAWGLSDRIRLLGVRKDIGRLMRAADTLLFPSAEEGLGMVAVEAQAAGTPVLASEAIPSEAVVIPELFFRESLDAAPTVWARTLLRVLEIRAPSPQAALSRFHASSFDVANSARRLEGIYSGRDNCARSSGEHRTSDASADRTKGFSAVAVCGRGRNPTLRPRDMKILFLGAISPGQTSQMRMRALERLGHDVHGVDTIAPWLRAGWLQRQTQRRMQRGSVISGINGEVLAAATAFRPNLVWAEKQEYLQPETLAALRGMGSRLVHFTPDPYFSLSWKRTRLMDAAMKEFDALVYCKAYERASYEALGKPLVYMPLGYSDEVHRPLPSSDRRWHCDVGFLGGWEPRREQMLHAVARSGVELKIWGYAWDFLRDGRWTPRRHIVLSQLAGTDAFRFHRDPLLAAAHRGGEVYADDYARALTGARIGLGFLRTVCDDQHTTRTFEIPACGSLLLADRTDEHESFFEDGTEAAFFSSTDEMLDKIRFYTAHEQARRAVAAAGLERCRRSGYSYVRRTATALVEIVTALGLPRW